MTEIFSYIIMFGIFLAGFVPVVAGIVDYSRKNRRFERENKAKQVAD